MLFDELFFHGSRVVGAIANTQRQSREATTRPSQTVAVETRAGISLRRSRRQNAFVARAHRNFVYRTGIS